MPGDEKDAHGLPLHFESDNIHVAGLIVSEYSLEHSHWNARRSLGEWLKQHNIPALFGIDTRMLTKMLREEGTMLGKITFPSIAAAGNPAGDCAIEDPNRLNLVAEVSTKTVSGARARPDPSRLRLKKKVVAYSISWLPPFGKPIA